MKRQELLRHLRKHGCAAVPRHREIHDKLARKICPDLGVPPVKDA